MESQYTVMNEGLTPKVLSEDAVRRLRSHFDYNKLTTGNLQIDKLTKIIDESKIEQNDMERRRMLKLAILTCPCQEQYAALNERKRCLPPNYSADYLKWQKKCHGESKESGTDFSVWQKESGSKQDDDFLSDYLGKNKNVMGTVVCHCEKAINFNHVCTLACNQININMLYQLFTLANTDKSKERVEFYLDLDEMMDLFKKLELKVEKKAFEEQLDKMDKDADGQVDWEEFLTIISSMLGAFVTIDKNDEDGTDFNQLRDSTKLMEENLINTNIVIMDLDKQIQEKKAEITKRINDTTMRRSPPRSRRSGTTRTAWRWRCWT